jgi:hypothetical protein
VFPIGAAAAGALSRSIPHAAGIATLSKRAITALPAHTRHWTGMPLSRHTPAVFHRALSRPGPVGPMLTHDREVPGASTRVLASERAGSLAEARRRPMSVTACRAGGCGHLPAPAMAAPAKENERGLPLRLGRAAAQAMAPSLRNRWATRCLRCVESIAVHLAWPVLGVLSFSRGRARLWPAHSPEPRGARRA